MKADLERIIHKAILGAGCVTNKDIARVAAKAVKEHCEQVSNEPDEEYGACMRLGHTAHFPNTASPPDMEDVRIVARSGDEAYHLYHCMRVGLYILSGVYD